MHTENTLEVRGPQLGVRIEQWRMLPKSLDILASVFRVFLITACLLGASMARGDNSTTPTLKSIGDEVQCLCGCNAPLNQCPHIDCAEREKVQGFIRTEIASGKNESTILADLSLKYGQQVLSTPPAHGLNLSIWILPGVGLLLGLGIVVVIVRRWKHKPQPAPVKPAISHDPKVLAAMEEEMKTSGMK